MSFQKELKQARRTAGLTQQALSELTHIPKRTIESWETGDRTPPKYVQRFLLNELKISKKNCKNFQKKT